MIKLIAIDIDGTLLTSERELTDEVKRALQLATQNGVKVVLCTGRPLHGVKDLLQALDIVADDQYVITYNGALVQNTTGTKTIASFDLTFDDFTTIQALATELDVPYHALDAEAIYTTNRDIGLYTAHESDLVKMQIRYRTFEELASWQPSFFKMMYVDEATRLDKIIQQLPASFLERYFTVKSAPYYLEILHKQAHKGSALAALATYLQIDLTDVMAIGDNYNDEAMLKIAGHSVAMGNAVPELKAIARYQTTSHDDNGVANIVNRLVNERV